MRSVWLVESGTLDGMLKSNASRELPRILLIDDDAISLEVLSMVLEMNGYPVDCVEDGAKALQFLRTTAMPPQVILMDTQMPGLNGLELVNELRRHSDARLIAISGSEVTAELREATDGFLLKPVEVSALAALLKSSNSPITTAAAIPLPAIPAADELDPTPETNPLIDPVILGKLRAMMPASALLEIYTAVASDTKTRLTALSAAIDAGDAKEVSRIAHTIKGGCAMVGFSIATKTAARLESSNRRETWPKELLQLHFAVSRLQGMLGEGLLE